MADVTRRLGAAAAGERQTAGGRYVFQASSNSGHRSCVPRVAGRQGEIARTLGHQEHHVN